MGLEKAGLKLITAWTKTSERSLLATRPVKVNIEGLKLAEPLSADTVNISKVPLLQRVLGNQTVEKEIYDVTKWQKEFLAKTYDGLKTSEERAAYIGKLRLAFEEIKHDKCHEFRKLQNKEDRMQFIRENFQYLHHNSQASIISILEKETVPNRFAFNFDNNKMFELVLKDKKYNLDYLEETMQYFKEVEDSVYEYSRLIDENIAKMGIKLPTTAPSKIPQQLKECEINEALYHSTPYYHGVRGGDEAYKMKLFKEHGSSRFGPINSTGTNVLFTTGSLEYAEHYGGPNVLKMYCRKDYPIVDDAITHGINTCGDWTEERLMYDLLYEKGIKFIKNGRETLIIDPKAVTFVSDFKNNYVP